MVPCAVDLPSPLCECQPVITQNLCVQPPTALVQNSDYDGFLADCATLVNESPQATSTTGTKGWTKQGIVEFINGVYTLGFIQIFPQPYDVFTYRGPIRLGYQNWNGI